MLYQETYRLWQLNQKTNRSIRSLVAQSIFQVIIDCQWDKCKPSILFLSLSLCLSIDMPLEQATIISVTFACHSTSFVVANNCRSIWSSTTRNISLQWSRTYSHLWSNIWHARSRQIQGQCCQRSQWPINTHVKYPSPALYMTSLSRLWLLSNVFERIDMILCWNQEHCISSDRHL
jgi:hypothetical protein